jgi:glyoxylase-like metal-dependent hydrolase (beta-lactamase superfamily II)
MQISKRMHLVGSDEFGLSYPIDCNCYLINAGEELALVDTGLGPGVADIAANIKAAGFSLDSLRHILITHAHIGHFGGADELRAMTGAKVWAPALGASAMENIREDAAIRLNFEFGRYPRDFEPRPCRPDGVIHDGDRITIGDVEVTAILVQGHTKDSTCFYFQDESKRVLCSGDVVFYAGKIGLVNLEGCSMSDYRRDIHKLAELPVDMLLPGHGVFVIRGGFKHIRRAARKLSDLVLPETFFEGNEFTWDKDYLETMVTSETE